MLGLSSWMRSPGGIGSCFSAYCICWPWVHYSLLKLLQGLRIELSGKSWRSQHRLIALHAQSVTQASQKAQGLPLHGKKQGVEVPT